MTDYKSYETERLILKPTMEEDADMVYAVLNTPKWFQFVGDRNIANEDEAKQYIKDRMLPQLFKLGYGNFTVIKKETGEKMGMAGLYDRDGYEGVDIGFAFLPDFERNGFAFEASERLVQLAKEELKMSKISGYTNKDNVASQGLLKKLGFQQTGETTFPGESVEMFVFTLDL